MAARSRRGRRSRRKLSEIDPEPAPSTTGGQATGRKGPALDVLLAALRLGLTSFGGPIAHIGYFRSEYVVRRRWLDERTFGDLVALCQSLPGPASSQLGIAIGTRRAGLAGGLAAWIGFTVPSAIALVIFGLATTGADLSSAGWVHGLKLAAVAIVAQAVLAMGRVLAPDWPRRALAVVAAVAALVWATPFSQVAIIGGGAIAGLVLLSAQPVPVGAPEPSPVSRRVGVVALVVLGMLLVILPLVGPLTGSAALEQFAAMYRSGALVFGGGHVVLPLLQATTVDPGWVTQDQFLAGYGAAQAVPGPLFTFAAYLGAISSVPPAGWLGGAACLLGIFLPSFLLIWGALPFWEELRRSLTLRRALSGANAAVVGLLAAALYDPVWTSAIVSWLDVAMAAGAFALLTFARLPPFVVVLLCTIAGEAVMMWPLR